MWCSAKLDDMSLESCSGDCPHPQKGAVQRGLPTCREPLFAPENLSASKKLELSPPSTSGGPLRVLCTQ